MSVGARIQGVWYLDKAHFRDHYQRVTVGTSTKLQRCRQYTLIQSMQLFGVTSWNPDNMMKKSTFSFRTGPESNVGFAWIGSGSRVFICSSDDLSIIDHKTGEAVRAQVWEHYTKWKDVPDTEFGDND